MKRECALCGRKSESETMVLSRFTRLRYCGDYDTCVARRAKRLRASRAKRATEKAVA